MKNTREKSGSHLYELNCLIGLRSSDQVPELAKKITNWIEKKKGELIVVEKEETPESKGGKSDVWVEKKRLAYAIQKDKAGYYLISWLKLDPSDIDEFRRFLKLEKEIIRYTILAEDKISSQRPNRDAVILNEISQLVSQPPSTKPPVSREIVTDKAPVAPKFAAEKEGKEIEEPKIAPETKVELTAVKIEEKEVIKDKVVLAESKPEEAPEERKKEVAIDKEKIKKEKPIKKEEKIEEKSEEKVKESEEKIETKEKTAKHKKITLEELDKRLDDILNEDIL